MWNDFNKCIHLLGCLLLLQASPALAISNEFKQHATTPQQDGATIKGMVVDENNQPLPGATVFLKGNSNGVITNIDGEFTFPNVPHGATLVVTYLGYIPQEIVVKNNENLTIQLKPKNDELSEVTVVAFAKQKKESVVASIATIAPKDLRTPSSNLTTALQGRVGGLISYQTSGEPGQDNASFFVRGVTTFSNDGKKDPLILIDGVELDAQALNYLNPDDIASFSVLKDASATSLYGARGANGVILVTTKQGKEGKLNVSARAEYSISKATDMVDIADPVTYMRLQNEAIKTRNPQAQARYSEEKIAMTANGRYPNLYPSVDWYDMLLKNSTNNYRADVSINGGSEKARYYVSGNYAHDNGNIRVEKRNNYNPNISINKYALRSNIDLDLTKTTLLYIKMYMQYEDYNGPLLGGAEAYRSSMQANPVLFLPYYQADAKFSGINHVLYGNYGAGNYINPYAEIQKGYKEYNRNHFITQLGFRQNLDMITQGLLVRGYINIDRYSSYQKARQWMPYYYGIQTMDLINNSYTLKRLKTGSDGLDYQDQGRWITNTFYLEGTAEYNRKFADKHDVNALLVYTMREQKYSDGDHSTLEQSLPFRNIGLAGRLAYNYDNRYMVEGNFGLNGSERFSKSHRWGFFPSIGAGWNIANEPFFNRHVHVFEQLKLRATYGMAGNDQIGSSDDRFYYMSSVNAGANADVYWGENMSYSPGGGFKVIRYANKNIGWETSYKLNIGVDYRTTFGLYGYVEYFNERRKNILLSRVVPSTTGLYQDFKSNLGRASGEGVDAEMNWEKSINKDFWVNFRGTFTYTHSKVQEWEEPDYSATPWKSHVGYSIGVMRGYIAERLFADDEEVKNSPTQPWGVVRAGDIKYRDVNNDGRIDDLDQVPIGYPNQPEINVGFGFSTGYKNFDVSCFFVGAGRQSFFWEVAGITPFHNIRSDGKIGENAVMQFIADSHWTETNPNLYVKWPRLDNGLNVNNSQPSTWWLHDASYIRWKSLEVGYTLPKKLSRHMGLSTLRLYFSGSNLLCWSKFKLWDPELGGNGLNYPLQRVFNFGLNLSL